MGDPWYNKFAKNSGKAESDDSTEDVEEYEPALDEIEAYEKLEDPYFHSDDS